MEQVRLKRPRPSLRNFPWSRQQPELGQPRGHRGRPSPGPLTADVVLIGVVHLLDPPVAEGQFPHPVHAAMDTRAQAQVGSRGRAVEAVGGEVVRAGDGEGDGREESVNMGIFTRRPRAPWVGRRASQRHRTCKGDVCP